MLHSVDDIDPGKHGAAAIVRVGNGVMSIIQNVGQATFFEMTKNVWYHVFWHDKLG